MPQKQFIAVIVGVCVLSAGIGSGLALLGVHWLGALVAVGLFAAWCARLPLDRVERL